MKAVLTICAFKFYVELLMFLRNARVFIYSPTPSYVSKFVVLQGSTLNIMTSLFLKYKVEVAKSFINNKWQNFGRHLTPSLALCVLLNFQSSLFLSFFKWS